MTSSLWPQLSLTRCTSGRDSYTGFLPKAVHLEWREHSLELTTCPPCRDNGGCLCQPMLMSSKWRSGLLAWLALRFQCPSDTGFFVQISLPWKAGPSSPSPSFLLQQPPECPPVLARLLAFEISFSHGLHLNPATDGRAGQESFPQGWQTQRRRSFVLTTANTMDTRT